MYALITKIENAQNLKTIYTVEIKERMNLEGEFELVIVQTFIDATLTSYDTYEVSYEGMYHAQLKARAIALATIKSL